VWAQICEGLESTTIAVAHLQEIKNLHPTTLELTQQNAIVIQGFWDWMRYWESIMDTSVLLTHADAKVVRTFAQSHAELLQQYVCAVLSVLTDLKYSVMILASSKSGTPNLLISLKWREAMGVVSLRFMQDEIFARVFKNSSIDRYVAIVKVVQGGQTPYALTLNATQSPVVQPQPKRKPSRPVSPDPPDPPTPSTDSGGGMGILFIVLLLLAAAVTFSKK
jgi:hypothetical protein